MSKFPDFVCFIGTIVLMLLGVLAAMAMMGVTS